MGKATLSTPPSPPSDAGVAGVNSFAHADPPSGPRREWALWLAQLGAVREAIANLPPMPVGIWATGCALLLLLVAARVRRSHRLIRRGRCAPPSVTRMVAESARELGLRRTPATLMVDARVSPLLWCGWRTCLVLPQRLWEQLDDVGRRAVIYHELAHLRRRDHWICRAEVVVGWLYWWHPVVWWVRRRLHEEADACCDVWVTSLLPRGRRAYAQALLETRKYLSGASGEPIGPSAVPSVGLGVSRSRTRRFARRLTMVMTGQTSPRLSVRGLTLAGIMAFGGYLAAPLWACPPGDKDVAKADKAPKPPKRLGGVIVDAPAPLAITAPRAPRAPLPPDARTTFEQFMRDRADRDNMSLEERIEALERAIERLHEQLLRMREGGVDIGPEGAIISPGIQAPLMSDAIAPAEVLRLYAAEQALECQPGPEAVLGHAGCCNQTVTRTYELSPGKLRALSDLMVRSDVPIVVSPHEDRIEVHATPAQHLVFGAFCLMINDDDAEHEETYALPEGKREALTSLMARGDVPILIHADDEGITVDGTDLEQAVFKAFVGMISADERHAASAIYDRAATAYLEAQAKDYETRAQMEIAQLSSLRSMLREQHRQLRTMQRQANRRVDRANQCVDKADECEDKADELEDEAQHVERDDRRHALFARAQDMRARAEAYRRQAEAFEMESDNLEDAASQIEDQIADLEDRIEELEERIEELREAAGDD